MTKRIHSETIEYQEAGTVLEGRLTYDDSLSGRRPAVLILHQWRGLSDYEEKRAEMLADLGYIVLAADIYGQGVRPKTREEAAAQAGKFKSNRALLRARARAGLETLRGQPLADPERIAAIGYCFGGTAAIELARSGARLTGVVSFHGGLDSPDPAAGKNITCRILVLHGADDPTMSADSVAAFENELRAAAVDWQLIKYGGAVHSFTDWGAGSDNSSGAAYNERADRRSWEAMKLFFGEIFK